MEGESKTTGLYSADNAKKFSSEADCPQLAQNPLIQKKKEEVDVEEPRKAKAKEEEVKAKEKKEQGKMKEKEEKVEEEVERKEEQRKEKDKEEQGKAKEDGVEEEEEEEGKEKEWEEVEKEVERKEEQGNAKEEKVEEMGVKAKEEEGVDAEEGTTKEKEEEEVGEEEAKVVVEGDRFKKFLKDAQNALKQGKVEYSLGELENAKKYFMEALLKYEMGYGDDSCDESHGDVCLLLAEVLGKIQGPRPIMIGNMKFAIDYLMRARGIYNILVSNKIIFMYSTDSYYREDDHDILVLSNLKVQKINALLRLASRQLERLEKYKEN